MSIQGPAHDGPLAVAGRRVRYRKLTGGCSHTLAASCPIRSAPNGSGGDRRHERCRAPGDCVSVHGELRAFGARASGGPHPIRCGVQTVKGEAGAADYDAATEGAVRLSNRQIGELAGFAEQVKPGALQSVTDRALSSAGGLAAFSAEAACRCAGCSSPAARSGWQRRAVCHLLPTVWNRFDASDPNGRVRN